MQYEYKTFEDSDPLGEDRLNDLGAQGWALMSMVRSKAYQSSEVFHYIFMKQK